MTTNDIMISILPYFVVIFLLYYVFSIIGNVLIFNKAGLGKKKWLGLIPIVNDFMLYKTFWNLKAFIVYIIAMTGNLYTRGTTDKYIAGFCLLASITVLIMEVMMADRISKAFGKNVLWTLGLLIIFPVFAIILGCKGDLTAEAKEKIENQLTKSGKSPDDKKSSAGQVFRF